VTATSGRKLYGWPPPAQKLQRIERTVKKFKFRGFFFGSATRFKKQNSRESREWLKLIVIASEERPPGLCCPVKFF
jgi:hypothetical protein